MSRKIIDAVFKDYVYMHIVCFTYISNYSFNPDGIAEAGTGKSSRISVLSRLQLGDKDTDPL